MLLFWSEQLRVEVEFVSEQQKSLGIGIESAERIDVPRQSKVGERAPAGAGFGRELREHAVGFVERQQHWRANNAGIAEARKDGSAQLT